MPVPWAGIQMALTFVTAAPTTQEAGMVPIYSLSFNAAETVAAFPPKLANANLRLVYGLGAKTAFEGTIRVSRWAAQPLPPTVDATNKTVIEGRPDYFTYDPSAPGTTEWHLNFAHHDLFAFYGSGLFAQDEMQAAEHPALASVREALLAKRQSVLTVENGNPTPILLQNVQRKVRVETAPNAGAGRPSGLYGNAFAKASPEAVRSATTVLEPPTVSNILAIVAPAGGAGEYREREVRYILRAAYTGFRAAKVSSGDMHVTVHTGFWGCGAFGGNRPLMTALQIHAAKLAGIHRVVFHAGDKEGLAQVRDAEALYTKLVAEAPATDAFVQRVVNYGFRWGVSDGN